MRSLIWQLRVVGWVEGASYLLLLGVAMPLKYLAGQPLAVRVVGMIHGLFFVLYVITVIRAGRASRWSAWVWFETLAASVIPCGPFLLDRRHQREEGMPTPRSAADR